MEHLTLFQTHQDYEAFVSAGTLVKPNISHCINDDEVHYNVYVLPTLFLRVVTVGQVTRQVICDFTGKLATIFVNGEEYFYRNIEDDEWTVAYRDSSTNQFINKCGGEIRVNYYNNEINYDKTITLNGYSIIFKYNEESGGYSIQGEVEEYYIPIK